MVLTPWRISENMSEKIYYKNHLESERFMIIS